MEEVRISDSVDMGENQLHVIVSAIQRKVQQGRDLFSINYSAYDRSNSKLTYYFLDIYMGTDARRYVRGSIENRLQEQLA